MGPPNFSLTVLQRKRPGSGRLEGVEEWRIDRKSYEKKSTKPQTSRLFLLSFCLSVFLFECFAMALTHTPPPPPPLTCFAIVQAKLCP